MPKGGRPIARPRVVSEHPRQNYTKNTNGEIAHDAGLLPSRLRTQLRSVARRDVLAVAAEAAQAERARCLPPAARARLAADSRAVEAWFAAEAREVREASERGRAYDAAVSAAESAAAAAELARREKERAASLSALFPPQSRCHRGQNFEGNFSKMQRLSDAQWLAENFPRMSPYEK